MSKAIEQWHSVLEARDEDGLYRLIDENAVFHSPVVHTPQVGRALVHKYLTAAFRVLITDSFQYVREIVGTEHAMLEFTVTLDGTAVNGVDIISWNEAGLISDFKVMIRPLKGINVVHQKMGEMLQQMK